MENGINKNGFFDLKVEPHLKPISDLGIGFYNLDENTATLRFQLSNSTGLLLISENNLSIYGYFESSNGSVSDVIELEIVDELNGIAEITLDQDFLQASTSTKVKGQLYIGVRNVDGRPDYNEVAVLGEFTFEVADALINKISSFTKIEYIRMFSQLKAQIQKEVTDIQEAIKNGADYVAEMQTVKEQGITQINKTVTEGKAYIDSVIAQAQTNINDAATSAIGDVNTAKDNALSTMTNTMSEKVSEVENVSNNAVKHVDDKLNEFNLGIEENSFIQPTDLDNKLNELEWQKYKTTNDDGSRQWLGDITNTDITTLSTGLYEFSTLSDTNWDLCKIPNFTGMRTGHLASLDVTTSGNGRKQFTYRQNHYNRVFVATLHTSGSWREWKEITFEQSDTGWVTFDLINGAKSNTAFKNEGDGGFDCAYRIITNGSKTEKRIRINASNITHLQQIAKLPTNFAKNVQFHYVRVPINCGYGLVGIYPNGNMYVYIESDKRVDWDSTSNGFYFYGEISWVE